MLDAIGHMMPVEQVNDLLNRLENIDTSLALAAEIELGLLWGLSRVTEVDFHPQLLSKRRPEAFCKSLFRSGPAYVEITAISNDSFSDRDKMERAANIISRFADGCRRGISKHLHFQFLEQSGYRSGRYDRKRLVTSGFDLTPDLRETIKSWIESLKCVGAERCRVTNDQVDVIIEWRKQHVHSEGRVFSTMPPIAYDLEDNPVFRRLEKKRRQFSGVGKDTLKCILLGDAGCSILRNLRSMNVDPRAVTGEQIIWHFLKDSSVDIVVVFSARREHEYPINSRRVWSVTLFDKRGQRTEADYELLDRMITAHLPRPTYESYQARPLHRQGAFSPQRRGREFLGTSLQMGDVRTMKTEVKFSARLFQEFIAGRIGVEDFRGMNGALEIFESELKQGRTLRAARLEPAGIDQDDDYLVFEFAPDPAASPLQNPRSK